MRPVDLIAKKRDGQTLSTDEIRFLVDGFTRGDIPDYQVSAWLMAVYLRGMSNDETVALTLAMANSGIILDLSDVKAELGARAGAKPGVHLIADKHSTGGVGDKTTITVAPLVAACGIPVGKMSGRGLGHTGGTLDKLDSIPGFTSELSIEQYKHNLRETGIVLAGQTHDLAPADGRLYALRDVTATVASVPLIAASVMSKKIAAGADAIVLDVKVGLGAFMQTDDDAVALASVMVEMGRGVGRRVSAVIAGMSQPLGHTVGNALEIIEAIEALRPPAQAPQPHNSVPRADSGEQRNGPARIAAGDDYRAHCLAVAAQMLLLVGAARDGNDAIGILNEAIASGRALAKFREWIATQGGDARVADDIAILPRARFREDVPAPQGGYIRGVDALAIGLSAMRLGAGRLKKGDLIDPAVGIVMHKKIGDVVSRGEPLLTIHANDVDKLKAEREALLAAYSWTDEPTARPADIHRIIR
jgi:pyrimidine-nucleoside phosphorylase